MNSIKVNYGTDTKVQNAVTLSDTAQAINSILNCAPWNDHDWWKTGGYVRNIPYTYTPSNYLITNQDNQVRVVIAVPGLMKDTISITFDPNTRQLLLKATQKEGTFTGGQSLPSCLAIHKDVDHNNASADYTDGILTILLPYKADLRTTRISVK